MSKKRISFEAKLKKNRVHNKGWFVSKINTETEKLLSKIFQSSFKPVFPGEVDNVGEWKEGDNLKITVENLDR